MKPALPALVLAMAALQIGVARAGPAADPLAPPPDAQAPMATAPTAEPAPLDGRRRPGRQKAYPPPVDQNNPGAVAVPPPEAFPADQIPIPDRWRLIETLGVLRSRWFDPYNQNPLKADRPIWGSQDWFFAVNAISDTVIEPRSVPTPVGSQTTQRPGSYDVFGRAGSVALSQTVITGLSLFKGSTAFKPPDLEFRVSLAFDLNYATSDERSVLSVDPSSPTHRTDGFVGLQEAFVEYHLRDVSERYDFDAVRVGIQPFSVDFRGFLFQDNQLGVRLFGDRDDNRFQYNLAFFARLDKEANSGLNDLTVPIRRDYVAIANLYRQDFPVPGFTSQIALVYNANREAGEIHYDSNGFPVVPALIGNDTARDYDVAYVGYNGDGRIGRFNLTASAYGAFGQDRNSVFTGRPAAIRAFFVAAEPSYDLSWARLRASGLYASGDGNPHDDVETGFDAILENPQFAGADTSYWIRQSIPFVGGGLVGVSGRNGVLADLRSSKDEGQSNFNNPGTILAGAGADFDLTPTVRVSGNVNHLWFANTAVVEALRQQGAIPTDLGWDFSLATIWRPKMTQNIVFRASAAVFVPGDGFGHLFTTVNRDSAFYSILINSIFSF